MASAGAVVPTVSITLDGGDIAELTRLAAGIAADLPRIIVRAVNRTTKWCETRAVKAITSEVNLKAKDLRAKHAFASGGHTKKTSAIAMTKATFERPVGEVIITGARIPLYRFGATPKLPPTKRGVSYAINKGQRKRIAGAWIARMSSGHVGVFMRVAQLRAGMTAAKASVRADRGGRVKGSGKAKGESTRYPIIELYGPSLPQIAEHNADLKKAWQVDAAAQLRMELSRQLDLAIGRGHGRFGADTEVA